MKIEIIGGSGFIGSYLCEKLDNLKYNYNNFDIINSKTSNLKYQNCDIRNLNQLNLKLSENSLLINLSAVHRDDVNPHELYYETNVLGTKNIIKIATTKNIKHIIFTSSVAIYGHSEEVVSENNNPNPMYHYGKSKLQAENLLIDWQNSDPNNNILTIIRPTVVFGKFNRGNFHNLIYQIFTNRFLMIGPGKNIKSIAYVENLVDFIIYTLRFKPGIHIYNYVDEPNITMKQLIDLIYNAINFKFNRKIIGIPYLIGYLIGIIFDVFSLITGRKYPISRIRIKKFCSNSIFSSRISTTGFKPMHNLESAIQNTVKFEYEEYINNHN